MFAVAFSGFIIFCISCTRLRFLRAANEHLVADDRFGIADAFRYFRLGAVATKLSSDDGKSYHRRSLAFPGAIT